jgi:prevent-host-death family protein
MINLERDIHSLTDFKRNTNDFVKMIRETKAPVVLTVNGKAELVVQDAASYQALQERVDHLETLDAIREGIASAARGELKPAEQVLAEMKAKYGIQG